MGCLSLRIRQIGPSNRRAHAGASKIPAFHMLADESCVFLVFGDPSRAGCGGGLPRIAHSGNWTLEGASFQRPPALRLPSLAVFDRPSHPHVAYVEAYHPSAASMVGIDDYWRSQSPEYFDEPTLRARIAPLTPSLS